jgi:carbon storage regulator
VVRIDRDSVRLGVSAPKDIGVHREEIYVEIVESNIAAAESATPEQLSQLLQQVKINATTKL